MSDFEILIGEFDASRRGIGDVEVLEDLQRLERKIFPKHESMAASFADELRKKNAGLIYAATAVPGVKRGEIVGYVMYSFASALCASISKLAVKESWRRRGLGEKLLRTAIEKCRTRKIHCVSLHVDPKRTPALSLYQKLGFKVDELIEGYYSPNRQAYRMLLDFEIFNDGR
ncbi:acyl-CoA N-acyltransferases (NAT) superfamily protein [Wolffia australiana]